MMMAIVRGIFLIGLILLYGRFFFIHEQKIKDLDVTLDIALPVNFHKISAGYVKQLAAEMLFIKTSVFLGGVKPGTPPAGYVDALDNNFEVMTSLYPGFIDPYYFCQGFLSPISPAAAARANSILETGIAAHPQDLFLRLFYGSNFFLSMNEPLKGAKAFAEAAMLPKAPPLFAHMAALLSARGGDIAAGLISLKTMLAVEKDEAVRARYQREINVFEQAMAVNEALKGYVNKYGAAPQTLELLVPEFLQRIPEIKDAFILVYDPPTVHLQRPDRTKKAGK